MRYTFSCSIFKIITFLNSIQKTSKKYEFPFNHWEYNNALSVEAIKELEGADIPYVSKHNLNYDGTRAIDGGEGKFREGISDGGKALKFRCFVTKENSNVFPGLTNLIKELQGYIWSKDKEGNDTQKPTGVHPDCIDAARYALMMQLKNPNRGKYTIQ